MTDDHDVGRVRRGDESSYRLVVDDLDRRCSELDKRQVEIPP